MTGHRSGVAEGTRAPLGVGRSAWAPRALATVLAIVAAWFALAGVAHAGLSQQVFISRNNKLYFVISSKPSGGSYG